jgi:transposase
MTYNNGGSSASHTSTRGEYLTTASDSDLSVCLQTLTKLSTDTLRRRRRRRRRRREKEKEVGEVVRDTTLRGGGA